MSAPPRLAVIVVNYNTRDLLRGCLASVQAAAERHAADLAIDLVVVDNASSDGSAAMVAQEFPAATLIPLQENRGFTGGNNIALRAIGLLDSADPSLLPAPAFVLLLNPDTTVQGDALLTMARVLADVPDALACGARLSYGDGRFQQGAFAFPGLAQIALDLLPLHRLPGAHRLYTGRLNGRYPRTLWEGDTPFPVDFVLGAALMARAEAIRRVGGLDEGFFMYCEEMDWCLRAQETGGRVYAVPQAHIVHFEAQSSRRTPWRTFERLWRSRFRFYEKHRARFGPLLLPGARLLVRPVMWAYLATLNQRFARGAITGEEVQAERAARRAVASL